MDEWNRYPINESEQPTPPAEEPKAPEAPAPEPTEPAPAPIPEPPVQQTPPQSYTAYGWNQSPYAPPPPKKGNSGAVVAVVVGVVCVLVLGTLAFLMTMAGQMSDGDNADGNDVGVTAGDVPTTTTRRNPEDLPSLVIPGEDEQVEGLTTREIVSNNVDSTVLLTVYTQTTTSGGAFGQGGTQQEKKAGYASGFILSQDGYIATNCHCVVNENTGEPYARVEVTLYDGTVFKSAEFIGADETTDLAVIKVDATGLQAATLGNSDIIQLGDRVVAIGNAGGLGFTATEGILSGLARDVYEDTGYAIKCFQVDASINPGNSGGPLFNAAGQVVAVNSAKIVAEGYEGLGFSIPINEAVEIFDDLMQYGYVTGRVELGVYGKNYNDGYYAGYLLYSMEEDSPLLNTEAAVGDLLTAVDDTKVTNHAELRAALAKYNVGDTVTLTLLRATNRGVESYTVDVVLIEQKG